MTCQMEDIKYFTEEKYDNLNETQASLMNTMISFSQSLRLLNETMEELSHRQPEHLRCEDNQTECNCTACINRDCHTGWIHFQNSCYLFGNDTLNWYEASSSCLSHHADLVKVETVDEETFLKTTARALGTHFWLGARDDVTEGSWVWSADDSDLDYTDWYPAEPNNYLVEEDCLELSGVHNWQWNDAPCKTFLIQFICEKVLLD